MQDNELGYNIPTQNPVVDDMAAVGRKGDSMMAHVTPGDYVIPKDILVKHPDFLVKLKKVMQDENEDYRTHMIGSGFENVNPQTGAPEFGFGKAFKKIARTAGGAVGGAVGNLTGNDSLGRAAGGITGAGLGGIGGGPLGAIGSMTGYKAGREGVLDQQRTNVSPTPQNTPLAPISEMALPGSIQELNGLTDPQQRSYLASQGSQGSGLGGSSRDYYLNLLQRNIQAGQGNLLPVESQYLTSQGINANLSGQDLINALRGI